MIGRYFGGWRDGLREGRGAYKWAADGRVYRGEWLRGEAHGVGLLTGQRPAPEPTPLGPTREPTREPTPMAKDQSSIGGGGGGDGGGGGGASSAATEPQSSPSSGTPMEASINTPKQQVLSSLSHL